MSRGPFGDPTIQILEKHEEGKKNAYYAGGNFQDLVSEALPVGSSQEASVKGYGQAKAIEGGPQPSYPPTLSA